MSLLAVNTLSVSFRSSGEDIAAVKNVSFSIEKGEILALVGESGSGKSVTALSLLQLLPYPQAYHPSGSITFDGMEILANSASEQTVEHEGRPVGRPSRQPAKRRSMEFAGANSGSMKNLMQGIRGNRISMIFQEPMTSLNPLHTLEKQLTEVIVLHKKQSLTQARERCKELLGWVGLPHFKDRLHAYPHELSGGERQRVMIAMAIANEPDLLIADEPTTAVDVTIQQQLLELLKDLQKRHGMAMLLITHDLTLVRRMAERVAIMKDGELVEIGATSSVFSNPQHAYTRTLLAAEPKGTVTPVAAGSREILECNNLSVRFPIKSGLLGRVTRSVEAVKDVTLTLREGETLGVVGESGSGKTTLGFALLRLIKSEGRIVFMGERLDNYATKALRPLRKAMQLVFQDPYSSLNPRMQVADIIAEGLLVHAPDLTAQERRLRVEAIMEEVGLPASMKTRYPHEFSGGQRQRISIARAMILKPKLVVLDEPTSALDLSVQAQIISLLKSLQEKYGLSFLFISHDLRVVKAISHRIIVMKNGEIVESGVTADIFTNPRQDYTKTLMQAAFG